MYTMFKRFISYYKPHRKLFFIDLICSFIISICNMFYPMIARTIMNDYVPNKNLQLLIIWAIVLALFSGTLCSSVFPILVAMAKTSRGRLSRGLTMGLMVGGTWGISGLVFLLVGITAKYFNAKDVLTVVVPAFYLFAALTALFTRKREKKLSRVLHASLQATL